MSGQIGKERFKFIPATHLLLIKNGKILLSKRANTGWEDGKYSVIAGHVDGQEKVIDAMIREAKEEAGLNLKKEDLKFAHVMHRRAGSEERVDFFFKLDNCSSEPENKELHKCEEMKWFDIDDIPENTVGYVREAIGLVQKGITYSEYGF